jgi:hypothetical protein
MVGLLELATDAPLLYNMGIPGSQSPTALFNREFGHDGAHPAPETFEGAMPNPP